MTDDQRDDRARIWAAILAIYDGFLRGDPAAVDAHLSPDATIWDSDEPELLRGRADLDALRQRRPAVEQGPTVTGLAAVDPVIDVWGDLALARHWVTVSFDDPVVAPQSVRVTTVWRRSGDDWLAVHNHEDVRAVGR